MDKVLIKTKEDFQKSIEFFGEQYKETITNIVEFYPCLLIGAYANDMETGDGYEFEVVYPSDFN